MRIKYANICGALTAVFLTHNEHCWWQMLLVFHWTFVKQFLALVGGPLGDVRTNRDDIYPWEYSYAGDGAERGWSFYIIVIKDRFRIRFSC